MSKDFEVAFKLSAELESTFSRAMSQASDEFKELKRRMSEIKGSRGPSDYTRPMREDTRKTQDSMKRMLWETSQSMRSWKRNLGRMAGVAGTGALAFSSLRKSMDFEEQMSSIQAVSGLTQDKMADVQKLALDMGAKTKYSALEAAKGMEELIKAGMSTGKMMDGGLESALNLAAAGGLELADSAEIMSTAMNAFKKDAMSANQAADILAGTANASATGVLELKHSLSQASAVASGVGMSFKDTNLALGVFANNGLKGGDAGTSLKTMLLNLTPATESANKEFERLNLITFHSAKAMKFLQSKGIQSVSTSAKEVQKAMVEYAAKMAKAKVGTEKANKAFRDVAFSSEAMSSAFYDNNGKLRTLDQIAGTLKNALKDLSDEQRQVTLKTMFGTDAIRAANILYNEGTEGVQKFNKEMSNVTALDVAKQKMDNAKGAVEQFQGALETLQIAALTPMMPKIKQLAWGAANASEQFGKWMDTKQARAWGESLLFAGKAGAGMYGAMKLGKVGIRTYKVTKNLKELAQTSGVLARVGTVIGALSNPIGIATASVAALGVGWAIYKRHQENARQEILATGEALQEAFQDYTAVENHTNKTKKLFEEYDRLKTKIADTKTPVDQLATAKERLVKVEKQFQEMFPTILNHHDLESGSFEKKRGAIEKEIAIKKELAAMDLQKTIYESRKNRPALTEERKDLKKEKYEKQKKFDIHAKAIPVVRQHMIELQQLETQEPSSEKKKKTYELRENINSAMKGTGKSLGLSTDAKGVMREAEEWIDRFEKDQNTLNGKIEKLNQDVAKVEASLEMSYEAEMNLIKKNIGGDLGYDVAEQAKKFNQLTEAEKKRFNEVLTAISQLNSAMKMVDTDKKINVDVMFKTTGQDWREIVKKSVPQLFSPPPALMQKIEKGFPPKAYAQGGFITHPHLGLVGEAGPEAIIPLSASRRTRARGLYEDVGKALGVQAYANGGIVGQLPVSGTSAPTRWAQMISLCKDTEQPQTVQPMQITMNSNPSIVIHGNANGETVAQLKQALQQKDENLKFDFEQMLSDYNHQRRRVSMDGAL